MADLLLHAARCEGAKLPRCKVHEAVAMPHIWPKQDSAQIAAAVTSCHGTCNTHRDKCVQHTFATHLAFAFIGPSLASATELFLSLANS